MKVMTKLIMLLTLPTEQLTSQRSVSHFFVISVDPNFLFNTHRIKKEIVDGKEKVLECTSSNTSLVHNLELFMNPFFLKFPSMGQSLCHNTFLIFEGLSKMFYTKGI